MKYIDSAVAQSHEHISCYFPNKSNCNILTCPINADFDMTIQLLHCAYPPAVRLTGGSGLTTYFNHTFDDSELVSVGGRIYIVTLTHPTTNQVGFAVSCMYRLHIKYRSGLSTVEPPIMGIPRREQLQIADKNCLFN